MKTEYDQQFKPGQAVITKFGERAVVASQSGCCVWLVGDLSGWHHPSNLRSV